MWEPAKKRLPTGGTNQTQVTAEGNAEMFRPFGFILWAPNIYFYKAGHDTLRNSGIRQQSKERLTIK
jgi:hypothetical protein